MSGDRPDTSPDPSDGSASPSGSKKPTKGKATSSPPKGAKGERMTAKEQREAFIRAARDVEADETGEAFNAAMEAVLHSK